MCGSDSRTEEISANADSVQQKRVETCAISLKMWLEIQSPLNNL